MGEKEKKYAEMDKDVQEAEDVEYDGEEDGEDDTDGVRPQLGEERDGVEHREAVLRDAVVDRLRAAGLDVSMDSEWGQRVLDEANGEARMRMGDPAETFAERQKEAEESHGVVMPGLNDAEVMAVEVPRHPYEGNIAHATSQAIKAAKNKYVPNGIPEQLSYNNYGSTFSYTITGNAIEICLSPKHQDKSSNKGLHLALAEHIDEIIGSSIEVEEHPDYVKVDGKRGEAINPNAIMHRFYGLAIIDGTPCRVMTLMREEKNSATSNGIHSYEVQKIEMLDNELPSISNGVCTPLKINRLSTCKVTKRS